MPSLSPKYELLANIQVPTNQPAPNMLLSTHDVNRENIKEWAILNSGASSHFLCLDAPVTNKQPATNPIMVMQPDGDAVVSTHTGDLDLPQLPQDAR